MSKIIEEKKEAKRLYDIEYRKANREKVNTRMKNWRLNNPDKVKEYHKNGKINKSTQAKEYRKANKDELNEKSKEYYQKNKEAIRIKSREYQSQNKEKLAEYYKQYRENNKDIIKQYHKDNSETIRVKQQNRQNHRLITEPLYKLKHNTRTLIRNSITRLGYRKISKTQEILGCSFGEFKGHLEEQFEPWMNWDNRGLYNGDFKYGWDIDHIIPLDAAVTEEDVLKLNHYTNLRPLCSKINRVIKRNF